MFFLRYHGIVLSYYKLSGQEIIALFGDQEFFSGLGSQKTILPRFGCYYT